MTNFLEALKSDLLSKRLLPWLGLMGVALLVAVAYAELGGGSSTPATPSSAVSAPVTPASASAPVVTQAPVNSHEATAETTSGTRYQRQGASRDPFTPLVSASKANTTAKPKTTTTTTTNTTTTTTKTTGSGGASPTTPAPKPKPSEPAYHVAALFGVASVALPTVSPELTPYESLKHLESLPSSGTRLLVYKGVSSSGKSAIFTLAHELILNGPAGCLPSASQCESITLKPGQTEEFDYLTSAGLTVAYQLQMVSIAKA